MERHTRRTLIAAAAHLAQAVVGLALVAAGTVKAVAPGAFIRDIWSYHLVPESAAYWIAAFLPWLEIVAGAALVTNRQRQGAHLIAAALLLVFLGAIIVSWIRGIDIACGCFGGTAPGAATNYPWLITRDLLLLAALVLAVALRRVAHSESSGGNAGPPVR